MGGLHAATSANAGPGPAWEVYDAPRDIAVYAGTSPVVLMPVESVDVLRLGFDVDESAGTIKGASFRLLDLSRRGGEDALFVSGTYSSRVYGILGAATDANGNTFAISIMGAHVEPPFNGVTDFFRAFVISGPTAITPIGATGTFDVARNTLIVTLDAPVDGRIIVTGGLTALVGCESETSCTQSRFLLSSDVAPDGGATYVGIHQTTLSWRAIFPAAGESWPPPVAAALEALTAEG